MPSSWRMVARGRGDVGVNRDDWSRVVVGDYRDGRGKRIILQGYKFGGSIRITQEREYRGKV